MGGGGGSRSEAHDATNESLLEDGNNLSTAERTLALSESLRHLRAIAEPAVAYGLIQ